MNASTSKLKLLLAMSITLCGTTMAHGYHGDAWRHQANVLGANSAVFSISDGMPIAGASATLLRSSRSISLTAQVAGLEPDTAYTVWWLIFNNPRACSHPSGLAGAACGEADIGDSAVNASVVWATGRVSDLYGFASIDAHLQRRGQAPGEILLGPGLTRNGAEIQVVLRSHGPASTLQDAGELHDALTSYMGGCATNTCSDTHIALFPH